MAMVFSLIESADQYLYHYTRPSTLLEWILPTKQLRMASITSTNDPRESKDWRFGFHTNSTFGATQGPQFAALEREATLIAKSCCKVICFTRDAPEATGFALNRVFDRGYCKPRMWAQYAENHRGACLVFDAPRLRSALMDSVIDHQDLFEGDVKYHNQSVARPLAGNPFILDFDGIQSRGMNSIVQHHIRHYWKPLFFEKLLDWRDEYEYRWILWDTEHVEHLFAYRASLVGVLLGPDFPKDGIPAIRRFRDEYGFETRAVNWNNGFPEILPMFWDAP